MNLIGLDIGYGLIKAVEVSVDKNKTELYNIAKASASEINLLSDSEASLKRGKEFLTDFVMQNDFLGKIVNVGVPQALTYIKISTFPNLKGRELENAIRLELEQESPIPINDASKSFQILPKVSNDSDKVDVLEVIAPISLTKKLLNIVRSSGMKISVLEPTALSNTRGIIDEGIDNPSTLIVDIGEKNTDIVIYSDFALRFTRSVATGFESIVKSVAQELDLEIVQAAEYVKAYGLVADKLDGKIKDAIVPIYSIILNEIKRSITFFETRHSSNLIRRVVLCGGGGLIPGVVVYTANFLSVEVQISNPWNRFTSLGRYQDRQAELEDIGPLFTTAVGLALKGVS